MGGEGTAFRRVYPARAYATLVVLVLYSFSRQELIVHTTFGRCDSFAPLTVDWIMNLCSKSDFDEISSLEAQLHL